MRLHFTVLCVLVELVVSQKQSPCPGTFSYEPQGSENDRWYGVISLKTSDDLSGVWLRLTLDRQAELIGNWFGEASSTDNKEFLIRNAKYKLEAGPPVSVRFFAKYNPSRPPPILEKITLNGKVICTIQQGESDLGPTTPTLHISQLRPTESSNNDNRGSGSSSNDSNGRTQQRGTTKFSSSTNRPSSNGGNRGSSSNGSGGSSSNRPSGTSNSRPSYNSEEDEVVHLNNNPSRGTQRPGSGVSYENEDEDSNNSFFQGDFAPILRPAQDRPVSSTRPVGGKSQSCGRVANIPAPLISHGQDTSPGQWPWHAALYLSEGIQLKYICGATLITDQHVVTAAHCVTKPHTNRVANPSNFLIYLGKHNLVTFGSEVQDRGISDISVHPEYNHSAYFNDIAVLKLSKPVTFTDYVRPCCLWESDSNLENVLRQEGTVVGWGFDQYGKLSNKLMQAKMPIVSTIDCIYSNRDFFSRFTFEKNYCAGFRNGTSVCNGDSGGGMVLPKRGTNGGDTVWQIRGLVSVGVALQGQGLCDTSHYIIFTDVAKYTNWIRQIVSN